MKYFLLFNFILINLNINAQKNEIILDSVKGTETYLTVKIHQFDFKEVQTNNGIEKIITAPQLAAIMKKDAPDLPKFTTSLIIPNKSLMQFDVINSSFTDYTNVLIAPSKGNFSRQIDPSSIVYSYGREYQSNNFFPNEIVKFDDAYIMRDFRGQNLQIFPFQYNPSTKTLRIFSEIKLKIYTNSEGGQNQFERQNNKNNIIGYDFNELYEKSFLNYKITSNIKNLPVGESGKMLIICHDDWMSAMQPFLNWKNTIGRSTTMVSVTQAGGTATNIKNYVTNYYNTNGLTYLLLVGDSAQVPTNSGSGLGGDSDNAYAYISGNDKYQEFMVGRFSAGIVADVNTQVTRTINYERGNQLAPNWLNKILSVASQEGPGADNELDYEHLRNIQTDLLGFTYANPVFELFEGSQGGFDAAGFPNVDQVNSALNSGAGIINYTGHGSDTSWGTTGFSNSSVLNLNNKNKLPFIFDVACVNGNFVDQTCFAESWVRAQKDGEPTGAIAIVASTINQSWAPPMVGQDEMNDVLVGLSTIGSRRTFGSIIVNGFFKMNAVTSDFAMTDTWTCFGDPSLLVRTNNPVAMNVNHLSFILASATSFNVGSDFNGALATLSFNGQIIGTANVVNGNAQIPVSNITPGQSLTLAVIGFNKVTYLAQIQVIAPTGSYLAVNSIVNNIKYGETKDINLSLKNVGIEDSTNALAVISSTSSSLTLNNPSINFGTISANNVTSNSSNAHTITVANNVQDQTVLNINVAMSDNSSQTSTETKNIIVNAPKFSILNLSVNDTTTNNNGILDPGETTNILVQTQNVGHADIANVIGSITNNSSFLTINSATTLPTTLNTNEIKSFIFNVTSNASTPLGTPIDIVFNVTGGSSNQYFENKTFNVILGYVPTYCIASSENPNDEFIQRVQFHTIDNTSIKGAGYNNYTNITTNVNIGQTIPITITNGAHYNGDLIGCWVDWNYDGDFNDTNESFSITYTQGSNNTGIGTGTINVPNNAFLGNARMRIRVQYQGTLSSCGTSEYGEVEDYKLIVQPALGLNNFENSFSIFPNPTKGSFTIQLNSDFIDNSTVLEIYNTLGQVVFNQILKSENSDILFNQIEGVYIVKIKSNNKTISKKLIVN
jgi:hypothetical protein